MEEKKTRRTKKETNEVIRRTILCEGSPVKNRKCRTIEELIEEAESEGQWII